jgi:DNA-binding transcriptional ArsR family regulator
MADRMPFALNGPSRPRVGPSAPAELAWLSHLVITRAPYSVPALEELAQLLPDLPRRAPALREEFVRLWEDDLDAVTELVVLAREADAILSDDPAPFLSGLEAAWRRSIEVGALRSESDADRNAVIHRLERLRKEPAIRRRYQDWLRRLWALAEPEWQARGRGVVGEACADLERRLDAGESVADWLLPRHPGWAGFRSDRRDGGFGGEPLWVSPLYFCLSGGSLLEVRGIVHVGLPGGSLTPSRKLVDANQVAGLLKVLSEPARVAVLLHLLSDSGGVMEISRQLRMSQPVVSGHLKQLREAGLVAAWTAGGRTSYSTDLGRVERLLDDARSLITHWRRPKS